MSSHKERSELRRFDRREFLEAGLKTAAVLPAVSLFLAGCGGGEEGKAPAAPTPSASPAPPSKPPTPPQAASPAAPKPAVAPVAEGEGQLVTEIASIAPMVTSLQYVNESAKPDQNCAGCQLYVAGSDGRGKCQLFAQGLVSEKGWCASWVARVS